MSNFNDPDPVCENLCPQQISPEILNDVHHQQLQSHRFQFLRIQFATSC